MVHGEKIMSRIKITRTVKFALLFLQIYIIAMLILIVLKFLSVIG